MKFSYLFLLLISANLYSQDFMYTTKPSLIGVGNSSSIAFDANTDGKTDLLVMGKSGSSYFTKLYHNSGDTTFLDLGIPFPGLAYGSNDILDYNNDGLMDIVMCGFDGTNKRFCLYKNKGNNLFSEVTVGIPGVDYSSVKCADINRDGWADIIISGQSATQKIFKIFKNEGNGSFTEENSLEGMYDGSIMLADINNDSYPDIVATGVTNSFELISKIYINTGKGDFSFKERTSNIPAIRGGKIESLDFNNDGYTDVLVTGKTINDDYISQIFRNNTGESLTLFSSLTGLYYATSAVGDFNNDGFPDILLSGLDATSVYKTFYYTNNTGSNFTSQTHSLPDVIKGCISPFDLTNDNKLDVVISGYSMANPVTSVYNNNTSSANSRPDAPYNLSFESYDDSVILRWGRPNDAETLSKGVTYDFYITKASDGDTIFTAPSDYQTGNRYVYKQGVLQDTFVVIKNMPYGKYYWSVQAIDQGYEGSVFATLAEFNICHNLNIGRDTSICKGNNIAISAGSSSDIVTWFSSDSPSLPFYNGNTATIIVSKNLKVWATVSTPIGCTLTDTIMLSALQLPETYLKSDSGICLHTNFSLSLGQPDYLGDWSSKTNTIASSATSGINFEVIGDETIYVKITDTNGCVNYDTTQIIAWQLPESFLPSDTSVCFRNTVILKAGSASDSSYWFNSKGNLLTDKNEISYLVSNSEDFIVKIVSPLKCTNFDTISLVMLSLPITNAGNDTLLCPKTSARLGKTAHSVGFVYEWTPTQSLDDSSIAQPKASPEITTEYILKITDANSCTNYDTVVVSIDSPSTINVSGDKFICKGNSVILGGNPTVSGSLLPYSYQWSPANSLDNNSIANPTANPDTTTEYSLTVSTGNCIVGIAPVKVTVWSLPIITKSDDIIIGYPESTQIWASGGNQYRWEPTSGLNNNTISNPIASPETTTTYIVFVTDTNGCESSAQVTLTVENSIFVPNLFTPNGDGKNDLFMVYGTGIDKIHLMVYTAEGIMVYETSDVEEATSHGWDGNYNGKQLGSGKYLWVLEATSKDGNKLLYNGSNKGIITLIR